jgi:hypothetical protein
VEEPRRVKEERNGLTSLVANHKHLKKKKRREEKERKR